jgi:hypothetical protein
VSTGPADAGDGECPAAQNDRVTAIAWSLVGLMAASLGVLAAALFSGIGRIDALGARIDGVGASMNARIDDLGASVNARIDGLGSRIDSVATSVNARIDDLGASVNARFDAQGAESRAEIREVGRAIRDLDQRLARAGS